ncbi:Uncharacterized protein APZ42_031005 [Daphnia magna]|uniref:Uncharacterized protein n=1 Tax=Daphnia magna TaxID=35525 RepID=A0A164N9L9_9CRUS|nr:Uncharacterized protein APZ42_031005 [Daphnia magna]
MDGVKQFLELSARKSNRKSIRTKHPNNIRHATMCVCVRVESQLPADLADFGRQNTHQKKTRTKTSSTQMLGNTRPIIRGLWGSV